MPQANPRAVIIGGGVAGAAIASELCRRDYSVTLIIRDPKEGSSFTNQKWSHSGLLYPAMGIARRACREFLRDSLFRRFVYNTRAAARFLALHRQTLDDRESMWSAWDVSGWGLAWRRLIEPEYQIIEPLGATRAIGGFEVPDRIVNFPALIDHLRDEVVRAGGVVRNAAVERIRVDHGRVTSIELLDGNPINCSTCILPAGAWSNNLLRESHVETPDLILRKCVVLEYEGEIVPGLTTCLDIERYDGTL